MSLVPTPASTSSTAALAMRDPQLPAHLREVCALLATGLLRLRSRTEADIASNRQDQGESLLHFLADQSVCANPTTRRPA